MCIRDRCEVVDEVVPIGKLSFLHLLIFGFLAECIDIRHLLSIYILVYCYLGDDAALTDHVQTGQFGIKK